MNNVTNIFKLIFFDKNARSVKANKNTIFMLLFRGINILISLMYVPLLINSLSSYRYGIWLTITSIMVWLNLFDMGLGNGLRNKLSQSIAKNDTKEAKYLISTAYASITILALALNGLFFVITAHLDWSRILNVPATMRQEVTTLVNMVFILVSVQFVLSIINSMLLAFHKPAYSSLITTFGQIVAFGAVAFCVLVLKETSLFILGLIISLSPVIMLILFTIYIFAKEFRLYTPNFRYIKFSYLNKILSLGLKFFALQIITIILYQTCNIIIAQNIGQEGVAEYNIAYKYIGLVYMVFSIIVTPYWSASTEAYARGDLEWIKQSAKKLNFIGILLSLVGVGLLVFSDFSYKIWIGKTIVADYKTLGLALIYFMLLIRYSTYGYILNGIGKIHLQLIITSSCCSFYTRHYIFV